MITKIKYRKDGKTVKWIKYYDDGGLIGGGRVPTIVPGHYIWIRSDGRD